MKIHFFLLGCILKIFESKLLFLFQMVRHGARAPLYLNSNNRDIFTDQWNESTAELTPSGERMDYLLGVLMRQKLVKENFISEEYNPNEFLAWSTNDNRTLKSAASYLLGLFPHSSNLTESQNKTALPPMKLDFDISDSLKFSPIINNIQPVPIIQITDKMFNLENNCYMVGQAKVDFLENRKVIKPLTDAYLKSMRPTNDVYESKLHLKNINELDYNDYSLEYCDTVTSLWTQGALNDLDPLGLNLTKLNESSLICNHFYFREIDHNRKRSQVYMSPYFNTILDFFNKTVNKIPTQKFFMICAHDTTIQYLVNFMTTALEIKDFEVGTIYFGSNVQIELREDDNKGLYINAYYNDKTIIHEFPFDKFKTQIENHSVNDNFIKKYCSPIISTHKKKYIIAIIILSVVIFALIISIIILIMKRKKICFKN